MDKDLGFGIVLLPAQIQFVNPLFVLLLVPTLSFVIYPLVDRFCKVTPLRKIGVGFLMGAASFLVIAWIENRIQNGVVTSLWWQILAYGVLTCGEVLISVTALEYSYKQAPLRMKSFVMALYLLSLSVGNLLTAFVASSVIEPLQGVEVHTGVRSTLGLPGDSDFVPGQKIDFRGDTGVTVQLTDGKIAPLAGTYIVGEIHNGQAALLDVVNRKPVATTGKLEIDAKISTYALVGPQFFVPFTYLMLGAGLLWIFVASRVKEQTFLRQAD